MTSIYRRHVLPHLIDLAMKHRLATERRARLVPQASGAVVEVGVGSGLNFPFYSSSVTALYGVDPSAELLDMARRGSSAAKIAVELMCESAERLPFASASMDTVVTTWTLCSIADPMRALREMRRILKPAGKLLFVEHGQAPDAGVRRWQDFLDPAWTRVAGGCHLNRPMAELIRSAGFSIDALETGYSPALRVVGYMYEGRASAQVSA